MRFATLPLVVALVGLTACTTEQLTAPFAGAANLLGDPAMRECRARVRQQAFNQGLNPAQAQERMRTRCG